MGCVFLLHQFLSIFARSCLSLNLTRFKLSPSQILLISSRSLTRFKLYLSLTLSNSICLMVSPMVLLNSLPAIPPEDPLGKDTIMQPVLEVIEVLVVVFAMDPSEVTIDAFLFHRGRVIEEIEDMVPNWDLDCGLEEMQLAVLAHCLDTWRVYLLDRRFVARTVVLSSHMYCIGNIRDEFDIYLSLLDEFDFELVYMTTRLRDFVEQVDGAQSDSSDSDSSDSDPSESESEEEPWVSLAIDNILRNAMFSESESEEEP